MNLKQVRQLLGLTQAEFAASLGIHAISVSRWEREAYQVPSPWSWVIAALGEESPAALAARGHLARTALEAKDFLAALRALTERASA